MTPDEIRELAERIAALLDKQAWVPAPVRPEPPTGPHPGNLPAWAASAQSLSDVAPGSGRTHEEIRHRPSYHALVVAARGAAAGRAPSPTTGPGTPKRGKPGPTVLVAVSNRHVHLSSRHVEALFGAGHELTPDRYIHQPGQFAAEERVRVVGQGGALDGVRVVGPARGDTQVELALSDCRTIGVTPVIRGSGSTEGSAPVRLEGPAGAVDLPHGAIVPARHLHLSPQDASRLKVAEGARVDVRIGEGARAATLHGVLVRTGSAHATELHVDVDEARACDVQSGAEATLLPRSPQSGTATVSPTLITERDVARLAAEGKSLSDASPYIVTPSARDRARALGIWRSP